MNGHAYVSVHYFNYGFPGDTWLMDCAVCAKDGLDLFPTWEDAMAAAWACVTKHEAARCAHCGRTS